MNKIYTICLSLCLLFGLTVIAGAQTEQTTPGTRNLGVRARQKNQAKRIRQGVRNKELTVKERASIAKAEKDVREEKREARADGTVTGAERKEIHQEQNQASRKIYRKKHNNRTRN